MEDDVQTGPQRYLTLTLAEAVFAIDIHCVREILDYMDITTIPHSSDCMKGVVNVRGAAVPVVDLGRKCGLDPVVQTRNTRIVIVEREHEGRISLIGALADSVREVVEVAAAAILPPPASAANVLTGLTRSGDSFILILDVARVFPGEELFDLSESMETTVPGGDAVSANVAG